MNVDAIVFSTIVSAAHIAFIMPAVRKKPYAAYVAFAAACVVASLYYFFSLGQTSSPTYMLALFSVFFGAMTAAMGYLSAWIYDWDERRLARKEHRQ